VETLSGLIDLMEHRYWARNRQGSIRLKKRRRKYSSAADSVASVSEMEDCFDIYKKSVLVGGAKRRWLVPSCFPCRNSKLWSIGREDS